MLTSVIAVAIGLEAEVGLVLGGSHGSEAESDDGLDGEHFEYERMS